MQSCPACGQENPDGFRLCGMCGAALAPAAAAREERKVVTVLFTDLVGFTSRSERLDPEDVRATLSPYYSRLRAEIERHGGTVEKFIGDAVMAVFGAPVAHEDDAERAVRAALAIRDALRELNEADPSLELQIRTAVNTGEALVALGARPSEGEAIASGDVVNTAARLQAAAPVDGILVGEATYRATRHAIDYAEAPPVEAKGKAEPVPVWQVAGARARFGLDVEEQLRVPLVGRSREREFLADALARSRDEQTSQLVTLVGVPGIGKSRLVAELFRLVDDDPDLIWWRQGRSLPYGESVSYWALGEIVKAQAGILDSDPAEEAETKLAAAAAALLADAAERRWVELHARPLVGLPGAGAAVDRRDEAFSAWRRLLEALAEQRPLVLVFEDLHWADDGLLDFVDSLAEWVRDVPMLVVGTARPELLERRPGWGGGKRNAFTLFIDALSREETAQLLGSLLDQTLLPADVQSTVLEQAEGNPLYAEEYVRMLQDRGFLVRGSGGWELTRSDELPLPETVQGMIAARLDALAPPEKELIQDAAVIGKVFWPSVLGATDEALHGLERKEFVRRERRSSIAGETQYAFLHALVRDVAYGQIPRARRMEKHRAVAEWIESLPPDRSEDRAEMLAHHYREALSLAEAAGLDTTALREPARAALAEASERAAALYAWPTAEELAGEALELTGEEDPLRPHLLLCIGRARASRGAPDLDLLETARDAFLAQGDRERAGETEALLSWSAWWLGDGERSKRHAAQAVEYVCDLPLSTSKVRCFAQAARRAAIAGEGELAVDVARQTLEMAEELGDDELTSSALNTLGMARVRLGEPEGLADLERSVELAKRSNTPDEIVKSHNNLANQYWALGRLDDAAAHWLASHEAALRYGARAGVLWSTCELAAERDARGELATAIELAEQVLAQASEHDQIRNAARSIRARVLAVIGRLDEALAESEETVARAREVEDAQHLGPVLSDRATILYAAGRDDEADALLDELLPQKRILRLSHMMPGLALLLAERGRGADFAAAMAGIPSLGDWHEASLAAAGGDFARAAEIYGAMGARFHEAWATLLAVEHGAPLELGATHAYFEREGAVGFARRCAALHSASA
jgi:class 3 adenylate cyclase/tetratricopeptide (TPR) repeat protein